MGLYWCTHRNHKGDYMTVLHDGYQCTKGNECKECILYVNTWEFVSCRLAANAIVLTDRDGIKELDPSELPGELRDPRK